MAPAGGEGSYQEQSGGGRGKGGVTCLAVWVFVNLYKVIRRFLSDPGVPGVRSVCLGLCPSVSQ